jgi:hypothetical protein
VAAALRPLSTEQTGVLFTDESLAGLGFDPDMAVLSGSRLRHRNPATSA